jgi:NitT/TauT family transport system substrate-binding protein
MKARKLITAVAVASALTLVTACGGEGTGSAMNEEGLIVVKIGRAPAFPQFPLFVAEQKGFFTEGGIEPEFLSLGSGPEQTAAQVSGDLNIVDNVPGNLLPIIDKGVDLKAFSVTTKASQYEIVVDADYPLTAQQGDWQAVMKELQGANVGVIAKGTGAEDIARTLFKEAGVDPEQQTYIATGLPSTTIAALENNQIDMAITIEPGIAQAVESGLAVTPFSIRAGDAPDSLMWPGVIGTVTSDFADQNPEVLQRYVDVMETTLEWIRDPAHRDEVISLMQSTLSVPASTSELLYESNMDDFADHVALTEDDVESLGVAASWVHANGKIGKDYSGEDFTVRVEQPE